MNETVFYPNKFWESKQGPREEAAMVKALHADSTLVPLLEMAGHMWAKLEPVRRGELLLELREKVIAVSPEMGESYLPADLMVYIGHLIVLRWNQLHPETPVSVDKPMPIRFLSGDGTASDLIIDRKIATDGTTRFTIANADQSESRQDYDDWRSFARSLRPAEKRGAKLGSHQTKKRESGKFAQERKWVGRLWEEQGLKDPGAIVYAITHKTRKTPEDNREWVAKRYCANVNRAIRLHNEQLQPDPDAIRILRIESYFDEESDRSFWKLTR